MKTFTRNNTCSQCQVDTNTLTSKIKYKTSDTLQPAATLPGNQTWQNVGLKKPGSVLTGVQWSYVIFLPESTFNADCICTNPVHNYMHQHLFTC